MTRTGWGLFRWSEKSPQKSEPEQVLLGHFINQPIHLTEFRANIETYIPGITPENHQQYTERIALLAPGNQAGSTTQISLQILKDAIGVGQPFPWGIDQTIASALVAYVVDTVLKTTSSEAQAAYAVLLGLSKDVPPEELREKLISRFSLWLRNSLA